MVRICKNPVAFEPNVPSVPTLMSRPEARQEIIGAPPPATPSGFRIPRLWRGVETPHRESPSHRRIPGDSTMPPPAVPQPRYKNFNEFLGDAETQKWGERGVLLILSRHGTSLFNRVQQFNGTSRSPLLEEGREQVRGLAHLLATLKIGTIYSSPLERARGSAEIIVETLHLALPVLTHHDLREFERGILEGRPKDLTSAEIDALFARFDDLTFQKRFQEQHQITQEEMALVFSEVRAHRRAMQHYAQMAGLSEDELVQQVYHCESEMSCRPPLGESWADSIVHAQRFITEELSRHDKGAIFVVGHGITHSTMIWELLGYEIKSIEQIYNIKQQIAGLNVLWQDPQTKKWELLVLNSNRFGD